MLEYIEREALLKSDDWQSLKSDFDKARAHIIILGQPAADVVSLAVFEQMKWERDTALQTLEEHGIGLAQKADVVKVVHGEWVKDTTFDLCGIDYYKCSVCGKEQQIEHPYCPNCGAKMDGETK